MKEQKDLMIIQGKARWFKLTGKPSPGFENSFMHWSTDVYVSEETAKKLKAEGLNTKDKGDGPFITFSRKEFKRDGSPNTPVRIVDDQGRILQDKNTPYTGPQVGNDSVVNVNFDVFEWSKGKFTPVILSLQIWTLIPYEGSEFPTKDNPGDDSWVEDAA